MLCFDSSNVLGMGLKRIGYGTFGLVTASVNNTETSANMHGNVDGAFKFKAYTLAFSMTWHVILVWDSNHSSSSNNWFKFRAKLGS